MALQPSPALDLSCGSSLGCQIVKRTGVGRHGACNRDSQTAAGQKERWEHRGRGHGLGCMGDYNAAANLAIVDLFVPWEMQ